MKSTLDGFSYVQKSNVRHGEKIFPGTGKKSDYQTVHYTKNHQKAGKALEGKSIGFSGTATVTQGNEGSITEIRFQLVDMHLL